MAFQKTSSEARSNGNGAQTAVELEEQVQELRREIAELARTLTSIGSGKVEEYRAGLDRLANEAVDASARAFDMAKSEAVSMEQSFERQVREHPLQALGIAAGIGFLAALLTRRN